MDQDPGKSVAEGNEFTYDQKLSDHLAKPHPVSTTIRHLPDHPFAGCVPPKFDNDFTFVF